VHRRLARHGGSTKAKPAAALPGGLTSTTRHELRLAHLV
jgi:hypothetical protein